MQLTSSISKVLLVGCLLATSAVGQFNMVIRSDDTTIKALSSRAAVLAGGRSSRRGSIKRFILVPRAKPTGYVEVNMDDMKSAKSNQPGLWTGGLGTCVGIAITGKAAGNAHVNILSHLGLGTAWAHVNAEVDKLSALVRAYGLTKMDAYVLTVDTSLSSDPAYRNDPDMRQRARDSDETYRPLVHYVGNIIGGQNPVKRLVHPFARTAEITVSSDGNVNYHIQRTKTHVMIGLKACLTVLTAHGLLSGVSAAPRLASVPPDEFLQPGADKANCLGFREALPGDTCISIALASGIPLERFLQINPQIRRVEDCPTRLLANFYYCVSSKLNGEAFSYTYAPPLTDPGLQTPPPPTPKATEAPAAPTRTPAFRAGILKVLPTAAPEGAKPPPNLKCDDVGPGAVHNQCYKTIAKYGPTARAKVSEWCKTFLWSEVSAPWFDVWDPQLQIPETAGWRGRAACSEKYNGFPAAMSTFCWCLHEKKYPEPTWALTGKPCVNANVKPCDPPP
ncbi:hypothetical protein PspLS_03467 [Pyricularia sp. CBS 133598]|nr:hypothetical protein PspLS_03467 [Pyricularia sp. CBS 133598]